MSAEQKSSLLDILHLQSQAWNAYYQKRTRECLALAKTLLQADPDNPEAQTIRAAVRADLEKEINDARVLIEDADKHEDSKKRRRTAEVMLLKTIYLDPDIQEAKVLLSAVRAMRGAKPVEGLGLAEVPVEASISESEREVMPATFGLSDTPAEIPVEDELAMTEPFREFSVVPEHLLDDDPAHEEESRTVVTETPKEPARPTPLFSSAAEAPVDPPVQHDDAAVEGDDGPLVVPNRPKEISKQSKRGSRILMVAVLIVVAIAGWMLTRQGSFAKLPEALKPSILASDQPASVTEPLGPADSKPKASNGAPAPAPALSSATAPSSKADAARIPAAPSSSAKGNAAPTSPARTSPSLRSKRSTAPVPVAQNGSLAVSSPTPAEIYMGNKYLGATPVTLELPAGEHTLEYRYQNLRTTATHVIKAHQTTTALITFDITVQINARPWAQVYVEGVERQSLGQTPLSNVRVPIGRVLVFENPGFPSKTYRVTGGEKTIQMVFQ